MIEDKYNTINEGNKKSLGTFSKPNKTNRRKMQNRYPWLTHK